MFSDIPLIEVSEIDFSDKLDSFGDSIELCDECYKVSHKLTISELDLNKLTIIKQCPACGKIK